MKICYIANSCIPSKLANTVHVMKMCQAYARLGHDVRLIVPDWQEGMEQGVQDVYAFYDVEHEFPIVRVPMPRSRRTHTYFYSVTMPRVALRSKPDLVHSRVVTSAWGSASLYGRPTLLETHQPPPASRYWRFVFNRSVSSRRTVGLIAITHALAEKFLRPAVPQQTRILVAPDGVDAAWLDTPLTAQEARAQVNIPDDGRPLAIYTGHLYPGRGIELIMDLAERMPDVGFLVVGGHERDVNRYKEMAGDRENLAFLGFKPPSAMRIYQQAADVLLMPYADRVEIAANRVTADFASPLKMFEYMAAGRPILSSDLPVLKEIIEDGRNALLLPYSNLDRWEDALRDLIDRPDRARQLGDNARSDVGEYTWEKRAEHIIEFAAQ